MLEPAERIQTLHLNFLGVEYKFRFGTSEEILKHILPSKNCEKWQKTVLCAAPNAPANSHAHHVATQNQSQIEKEREERAKISSKMSLMSEQWKLSRPPQQRKGQEKR